MTPTPRVLEAGPSISEESKPMANTASVRAAEKNANPNRRTRVMTDCQQSSTKAKASTDVEKAKKSCFENIEGADPGTHLATGTDYKARVLAMQQRNKNLVHRDWKVPMKRQSVKLPGRACILTFDETKPGASPKLSKVIDDAAELGTFLQTPANTAASTYRLYLLEGTPPEFVEQFGNFFDIDPAVFARHQRTGLWEGRHKAGSTPPLASNKNPAQSFMMEYGELIFFADELKGPSFRNPNDHRHISVSKKPDTLTDVDKVGILHRKASFWSKSCSGEGWDVLLILDPPLPIIDQKEGHPARHGLLVGSQMKAEEKPVPFYSELYQGGYLDFIKYEDLERPLEPKGPPRTSMLDDICFYWKTYPSHIVLGKDPRSATIFLQKIIASNYLVLAEYLKSLVNELEFNLVRTEIHGSKHQALDLAHKWSVLQSWSHRFPEYAGMVHDILEILETSQRESRGPQDQCDAWEECKIDFVDINKKITELRGRTEKLSDSFIGLSNMAGIQESLDEAKNVKLLTFLGLFFLPLSLIATIFAMGEKYGPTGPKFYVYFCVSFPIAVGLVISSVLGLYDLRRAWNLIKK